jgi:hypothetical protein
MPSPPINAASAMTPAAAPNVPRGENTTMSAPPTGLAATWATWTAIRISDRAGTYAASGTAARSSAPWVALASPLANPAAVTSVSSRPTDIPGKAITAVSAAAATYPDTRRRRGGTRSTRLDSSVPVTRNGRNPSANDSDDRTGEWVRS